MDRLKRHLLILFIVTCSSISYAQTITKDSDLIFPGVISDQDINLVTSPSMNGFAAEFEFITDPSIPVTVAVEGGGTPTCEVETGSGFGNFFSKLICRVNKTGITFTDFTFGGDLTPDGTGTTDSILGRLNIKIGGRAEVPKGALSGEFQEPLTLRVTGQGIDKTISFLAKVITSSELAITVAKGLQFPISEQLPYSQKVVVAPADLGAAVFHVVSDPYDNITASVPTSVNMTNGNNVIVLDTFIFGGGVNSFGNGTLDDEGNLTGYIGGTANIPPNPTAGTYSGTVILTVVKN